DEMMESRKTRHGSAYRQEFRHVPLDELVELFLIPSGEKRAKNVFLMKIRIPIFLVPTDARFTPHSRHRGNAAQGAEWIRRVLNSADGEDVVEGFGWEWQVEDTGLNDGNILTVQEVAMTCVNRVRQIDRDDAPAGPRGDVRESTRTASPIEYELARDGISLEA